MKMEQILELDMSKQNDSELIQQLLHKIPYISSRHESTKTKVEFDILENVLTRLRSKDLAISFIMSDQQFYEMILLGVGRWCLPDKDGRVKLYRQIGNKVYCRSLYECVAKAVICLYMFIQQHKTE